MIVTNVIIPLIYYPSRQRDIVVDFGFLKWTRAEPYSPDHLPLFPIDFPNQKGYGRPLVEKWFLITSKNTAIDLPALVSFAKREGYAVMHDCLVSDVLSIFRKIKFLVGLVTIGMEELTSYTAHTPPKWSSCSINLDCCWELPHKNFQIWIYFYCYLSSEWGIFVISVMVWQMYFKIILV